MVRKMRFADWARKWGDRWWKGPMRAAGYGVSSRITENDYNEALGRVKKAPPLKPAKPAGGKDANHGIGA